MTPSDEEYNKQLSKRMVKGKYINIDGEYVINPDWVKPTEQYRIINDSIESHIDSLIYVATNTTNNKRYVGQTVYTLPTRMNQHIRDANNGSKLDFHKAIREYGVDAFIWEEIPCPPEGLNQLESYMIEKLNTKYNGYNMMAGPSEELDDNEYRYSIRVNETQKDWLISQRTSVSQTMCNLIDGAIFCE